MGIPDQLGGLPGELGIDVEIGSKLQSHGGLSVTPVALTDARKGHRNGFVTTSRTNSGLLNCAIPHR